MRSCIFPLLLACVLAQGARASIDPTRLGVLNSAQTVKIKTQTQCKEFKDAATASLRNGSGDPNETFVDPFPSQARAQDAYHALKLFPATSNELYQADHAIIFGANAPTALEFQLLEDVDPCPAKNTDQLGLALRLIKSANTLTMTINGKFKLADTIRKQIAWELKHPLSSYLMAQLYSVSEELGAMDKEGINKLTPDQLSTLSLLKAALDARKQKLSEQSRRLIAPQNPLPNSVSAGSMNWKDLSSEQLQVAWTKDKESFTELGPFIPKLLQMLE